MKYLLRNFLINLVALLVTTKILPGLVFSGEFKQLATAALVLMILNIAIVPLLKVMFLPLNILTFGVFTWLINVLALYLLTIIVPQIKIIPFYFAGATINGFNIPAAQLSVLLVAILASFLIGFISHILSWLYK